MLYAIPLFSMRATCLAHLILLHLNILIVFREEFELSGASLRSFLQPPITLFFLGSSVLLNSVFSNALNLRSYPVRNKFHFHVKQRAKL
jgi:membrane-bound acyltransferase YfiQ involved in biofilm formation